MRLLRAVLAMTVVTAGQLLFQAGPAFACSCQADVQVADALATSDGAFVGVLTGRDDPLAAGPLVSSGWPPPRAKRPRPMEAANHRSVGSSSPWGSWPWPYRSPSPPSSAANASGTDEFGATTASKQ